MARVSQAVLDRDKMTTSMPQYTATQLRKAWKSTMQNLEFRVDHSMFVKSYGPIRSLSGVPEMPAITRATFQVIH
jgi:hypothetical protein